MNDKEGKKKWEKSRKGPYWLKPFWLKFSQG